MTTKAIIDKETAKLVNCINQLENDAVDQSYESIDDKIRAVQDKVFEHIPCGEYKVEMLKQMLINESAEYANAFKTIDILAGEIEILRSMKTIECKRLYFSLLIHSKLYPHETNWIAFNKDAVIRTVFDETIVEYSKHENFSELIKYGLDFRVIGSKSAIPCYRMPDVKDISIVYSILYDKKQCYDIFEEVIASD